MPAWNKPLLTARLKVAEDYIAAQEFEQAIKILPPLTLTASLVLSNTYLSLYLGQCEQRSVCSQALALATQMPPDEKLVICENMATSTRGLRFEPLCREAMAELIEKNELVFAWQFCQAQAQSNAFSMALAQACQDVQAAIPQLKLGQSLSGTVKTADGELWYFEGEEGQIVSLDMAQTDESLDSYLRLFTADYEVLAEDDDNGGDFNARLVNFTLPHTGLYYLQCYRL